MQDQLDSMRKRKQEAEESLVKTENKLREVTMKHEQSAMQWQSDKAALDKKYFEVMNLNPKIFPLSNSNLA
jgi:hypothetical protein